MAADIEPTDPVQFLDDKNCHREFPGYSEPGWYFYDESWAYAHGPFASQDLTREECKRYGEFLNNGH